MTRFSQHIHDVLGALGQEPIGRPGVVVMIPDDYLPEPRPEGTGGANVAAGGAGTRSEIAIACQTIGNQPNLGLEITDMYVRTDIAQGGIEVGNVPAGTTFSGYTNIGQLAGDFALGITVCRVFTKNTAAAIAMTTRFSTVGSATAGEWTRVGGIFRLRGAPGQNIMIVRASADNRVIGVRFRFRELEKRRL